MKAAIFRFSKRVIALGHHRCDCCIVWRWHASFVQAHIINPIACVWDFKSDEFVVKFVNKGSTPSNLLIPNVARATIS